MEEPNLFSGLVYCSDCGKYLVLCRTEKMREDQYYFRCSTYGKRGKDVCTPHQIREVDLKQIVLDDLRRVTHFARMKERQFAEYINQKTRWSCGGRSTVCRRSWTPCIAGTEN